MTDDNVVKKIKEAADELGIQLADTDEESEAVDSNQELDVITLPKESDIQKVDRMRYQYYGFLRKSNKPTKGANRIIKFPPIKDEEDINEYFNRCHDTVGARPAPIGPMKKQPVNSTCICKSKKKFKKCCGRGL